MAADLSLHPIPGNLQRRANTTTPPPPLPSLHQALISGPLPPPLHPQPVALPPPPAAPFRLWLGVLASLHSGGSMNVNVGMVDEGGVRWGGEGWLSKVVVGVGL